MPLTFQYLCVSRMVNHKSPLRGHPPLLALSIKTMYSEDYGYPRRSRSIHWTLGSLEGIVDLFCPRSFRGIRHMFGVQRFPFGPRNAEGIYEHYFARGGRYRRERLRYEAEEKSRMKAKRRAEKAGSRQGIPHDSAGTGA